MKYKISIERLLELYYNITVEFELDRLGMEVKGYV